MKRTLKAKLQAARKSVTVWVLTAALVCTEALPHLIDTLPLAREAFDDDTYKLIVRAAFIIGIAARLRRVKAEAADE